jgi:hypothetical protein
MTGPLLGWPDGVKDDVRAAGQRTLEAGFGGSDCLCHGAVGNLFVLERLERDGLLIESTPPGVDLADARHRLLCGIAERVKGRSVRCGIHGRVEVPGLFSGLAGVGLAFVNDVLGVDLSPVAIGGPPAWRPLF